MSSEAPPLPAGRDAPAGKAPARRAGARLLRAARRHPRGAALAFGLGVTMALWLGAEAACGIARASRRAQARTFEGDYARAFFASDPLLGYRPIPARKVTSRRLRGETVLYDVTYTIDAFGRRMTPVDSARGRARSVVFFGDSFTFGEGVEDDETLPARVAALVPDVLPVNAGCGGYGPQQALASLQHGLAATLRRPCPFFVYLLNDQQVRRAVGSMRVTTTWGADMPCYELDRAGALRHRGTFATGRPWRSALYAVASRSQVLKVLGVDLPVRLAERHHVLTARILEEAARLGRQRVPESELVVVLYPGSQVAGRVLELLERSGVTTLDYSALFHPDDPGMRIPDDGHPTTKAHALVAQRLVRDLGLGRPPRHGGTASR